MRFLGRLLHVCLSLEEVNNHWVLRRDTVHLEGSLFLKLHGILENEMLFKKQDVLLLGRQTLEVDALHHQLLLSQQYRINIELHQLLRVDGILAFRNHEDTFRVAAELLLHVGCLLFFKLDGQLILAIALILVVVV